MQITQSWQFSAMLNWFFCIDNNIWQQCLTTMPTYCGKHGWIPHPTSRTSTKHTIQMMDDFWLKTYCKLPLVCRNTGYVSYKKIFRSTLSFYHCITWDTNWQNVENCQDFANAKTYFNNLHPAKTVKMLKAAMNCMRSDCKPMEKITLYYIIQNF